LTKFWQYRILTTVRKELLWAVVVGISFGLIIAFGAWRINSSLKTNPTSTPSPTNSATSEFKIVLAKPGENDVVTTSPVTVSGITKAVSWVTLSGEKGDYTLQSDSDGTFTQDIDLIPGVNQIKITAFDKDGNQSLQKVLVVYSSIFQEKTFPTPTPNANASGETEIRQKVAEKVAQALNQPKAYIGVVTDIADSTIQIKTTDSQIEQISIADQNITVINAKGTNSKQVKLTDIAIGDFIVAMGYIDGNSVLDAQRILITDPAGEPKINAAMGRVTDTSKNSASVANLKDNQTTSLTPGAKTTIQSFSAGKFVATKLSNIGSGDVLIYVIDSSPTTPVVRSIFVIQKS
jgi:hypothetical protein